MDQRIVDLSKYRYEKALTELQIAKMLYDAQIYNQALSDVYYAVFSAVRAVNALEGFDSSKHTGVIAYFNKEHIKNGDFSSETSRVISEAKRLREYSDYEDYFKTTKEEVLDMYNKAQAFINDVQKYLKNKKVL